MVLQSSSDNRYEYYTEIDTKSRHQSEVQLKLLGNMINEKDQDVQNVLFR